MSNDPTNVLDRLSDYVSCAKSIRDYRRRCRVALGEFQKQTRRRLWLRYQTIGDIVTATYDKDTGDVLSVLGVVRGFPAGCIVAFADDDLLYMGSSFCCRKDKARYNKDVGRWQALSAVHLTRPWAMSTSFADSVRMAEFFPTASCRAAVADFHHWLCRNKAMVTDMADKCEGQFCDTAPPIDLALPAIDEPAVRLAG